MKPIFLDTFDTVDYKPASSPYVAANLQLQLLFGRRVVLSQTQAFDNRHFLNFLATSPNVKFLHHFIRGGRLYCHRLQGRTSLPALLAQKVADPEFHLSGWPEVEDLTQKQRADAAKLFTEAARDREAKLGLGSEADLRMSTLHDLDRSLQEARNARKVPPTSHLSAAPALSACLRDEALGASTSGELRADILALLADPGGNSRSSYHRAIKASHWPPSRKKNAHDLVNACYNTVVATSVGAESSLTVRSKSAQDALRAEHSIDSSWVATRAEASTLRGLGWDDLWKCHAALINRELSEEEKVDTLKQCAGDVAQQLSTADKPLQVGLRLLPILDKVIDAASPVTYLACSFHHALPAIHAPFANPILSMLIGEGVKPGSRLARHLQSEWLERRSGKMLNLLKRASTIRSKEDL
jgi:hypothetical protein